MRNETEAPVVQDQIAGLMGEGGAAILYGAGSVGRDVHALLHRHGVEVRCFLDRRAEPSAALDGIPVFRPEEAALTAEERRRLPVVISIFNRDADVPVIARNLAQLGYGRIISFVELHALFPDELGDRFWLTARTFYDLYAEPAERAAGLWADAKSERLYAALLAFRRTGVYSQLPRPEVGVQYLPADIPGWPPSPLRFVDCGAFTGDTLASFLGSGVEFRAVAAFEPDLANFRRLATFVRDHQEALGTAVLFPCGAGSQTGTLAFALGRGEGSQLQADGESAVMCVALDDALAGFRPNLIKMDIEGAELQALEGARSLIAHERPALAISVYHRPGHLWEIPMELQAWQLGYRFYLRVHGFDAFDTVLYALP